MYHVVSKEHVSLRCPDCGASGSAEISDVGGYAPEIIATSGFYVRITWVGTARIECGCCGTPVYSIEEP
jgi:hypothetical protein